MSTVTSDFNLRRLVRQELESSPQADPRVVAGEIAKLVPEEHLRSALQVTLVDFVRVLAADQRRHKDVHNGESESRRWAAASEVYLRLLRQREYISTDGEWKFLGDCTLDDVRAAAQLRFEKARQNATVGQRYQRLAEIMAEHDAPIVADLPQDVAMAVLG